MAAAAVGGADLGGALALVAEQAIEDGGFAHAGRADESGGLARSELRGKRVQVIVGAR
jgi:hypothetical protein